MINMCERSELKCPAISVYVIGTDPPIIDRIISSYNHGSEVLQDFVKKKLEIPLQQGFLRR